jgi:hypothetical protein
MRPKTEGQDTDDTLGDWTYRETIDDETSSIRVRGRVDRLGVDLLRATIEELDRRGHPDITVTIERPGSVDSFAHKVLAETAAHLAGHNGRLTISWAADEGPSSSRAPGWP